MKFEYLKQPNFANPSATWISRPMLNVKLSQGNESANILALVDSGADCSLFHSSVAEILGINVQDGRHQQFFGISATPLDVYFHTINLQISGDTHVVPMEVGFADLNAVGGLLGQRDFFQNFKIAFERHKDRFEISPVKN
jgi:hypothetical protein